jgi:hypothetical protein
MSLHRLRQRAAWLARGKLVGACLGREMAGEGRMAYLAEPGRTKPQGRDGDGSCGSAGE